MKNIIIIKLFFILSLFNHLFSQTTITTVANGFWSNPLTWDSGIPQSNDNIIVNHTLEVDVKDTVTNIIINNVTTLYDTLFIKGVLNIESESVSIPVTLLCIVLKFTITLLASSLVIPAFFSSSLPIYILHLLTLWLALSFVSRNS